MLPLLLQTVFGLGPLASEIIIIIAAIAILFVIFRLGKFILGILANTILGLISIFVLNGLFNIGIPISWPIIIVTAIFGLPAVAILTLLRLLGVPL